MTLHEFYTSYIFTRKAVLLSSLCKPLNVYLSINELCIAYASSPDSVPLMIPHHQPISCLAYHGIKIFLLTDPIYLTASTLTGVISIPVPVPDELPF